MRRVWVTGRQTKDITAAAQWGQLCHVMEHGIAPLDVKRQEDVIAQEVMRIAGPDDLVLMSGPMTMVCTLALAFMSSFGVVRTLCWDPVAGEYVERHAMASRWRHGVPE